MFSHPWAALGLTAAMVLIAWLAPLLGLGAVLKAWQLGVGGAALVVGGALVSIVVLVGTLQGSVEWEYRKARKIDRATHDPHDFEDPR